MAMRLTSQQFRELMEPNCDQHVILGGCRINVSCNSIGSTGENGPGAYAVHTGMSAQ